jgi:hypothetical protein
MRRRLDLAASLVGDPRVLYLDEPTTGLDPRSRTDVWGMVRGLVANGVTVLLTTQYLEEADQLAHDIAVIDHDQVVATGTPDELKAKAGSQVLRVAPADPARMAEVAALMSALIGTEAAIDADDRAATAPVGVPGLVPRVFRELDDRGIELAEFTLRRASQPGLAYAARAGEGDQPGRAQVFQHPGDVLVTAHETGQRARHPEGGGAVVGTPLTSFGIGGEAGGSLGRGGRPFTAPQDAEVDRFERGGRIHAELIGEQSAALVVGRERFGLAAGRVQRAHEQGPGTFGQRVGGEQHAQLADQAGSLAEGQVGLDAVGQHAGAQLGQPLEGHHVDGLGRHGQTVSGRVRLDHVADPALAQFGPQPGDQRLQRVTRVARRVAGPDLPGQRADRDDTPGVQGQQRQQNPQLTAADVNRTPRLVPHLQRTQ